MIWRWSNEDKPKATTSPDKLSDLRKFTAILYEFYVNQHKLVYLHKHKIMYKKCGDEEELCDYLVTRIYGIWGYVRQVSAFTPEDKNPII